MTVAFKSASQTPAKSASGLIWWIVARAGIATGILFRVLHLGRESLWFDEGYSAWMVGHSPGEIVRLIRADTAPPLYYLMLHGWTEVFGRSEAGLRSLSTLLSILTLFIALDIARRMLREPAAVAVAAWAFALSYLQFWYAREARAYSLMGFFGVAMFDCLLCYLRRGNRGWLVGISVLIAAGMYTHNMMAPYVAGLLVTWMVLPSAHSTRRRFREIAAVVGIAIVLYLPWAIWGLPAQWRMIRQAFWVDPLKAGDFFSAMVGLAGIKQYWSAATILQRVHLHIEDGSTPAWIGGILLVASAMWAIGFQNSARRREAVGLMVIACFAPVAVALYGLVGTPLFTPKLFLPSATLLPIFVLLPLGMPASSKMRWAMWGGTALLLLLSGLTLYGDFEENNKENWREIARIVSSLPAEKRLIVFVASDGELPFDYYYHYRPGDKATGVPAGFFDLNPPRTMRRVLGDGDLESLKAILDNHDYDQVVLALAHVPWGDPEHRTEDYLEQRFGEADGADVDDLSLRWYDAGELGTH